MSAAEKLRQAATTAKAMRGAAADPGRLREEMHIVSAQVGPGTGRCSICKQSFPLGTKIAIVCPSCAEGKSDGEG